ncbi:TlpA disulfide reductase family protein [Kaarinaea lacus]
MFRLMPTLFAASAIIILLYGSSVIAATATQNESLSVADVDIPIEIHPANGTHLAVWLPSEAGPQTIDASIAAQLADLGIEVWRVDLVEANFLPTVASSLEKIPATQISALITYARQNRDKKILFITTGRGAIPVLRGMHQWQFNGGDISTLTGVVLLSPKFFVETPDPGLAGELMPIVSATNLPVFVIQPSQSPWYWKLKTTISALEREGSDVYVRIIKNARDRYYFRPDATDYEKKLTAQLPLLLKQAATMLDAIPAVDRPVSALARVPSPVKEGKKDRQLTAYKGDPKPSALILPDMNDNPVDLKELKGQVVLINFWASWCPPCVHEMPSMQRLKEKMAAKPFVILAVNMAEDKNTVKKFLKTKVSVDFPILFDYDGKALQAWQVFAFPTSYVVDKAGTIRYALFGGIDWDENTIVDKLSALAQE